MQNFGGFLALEETGSQQNKPCYDQAVALSTARSCLALTITHLKPKRVLLPNYICRVVINTVQQLPVEMGFYDIDLNLLPTHNPVPASDDLWVLVNYFGIRGQALKKITQNVSGHFFIDNAQAFFEQPIDKHWIGYSARKFFGVADGAYLVTPYEITKPKLPPANPDFNFLLTRDNGGRGLAYLGFKQNEALHDAVPRQMSQTSQQILATLDYSSLMQIRRSNAVYLHSQFQHQNRLLDPLPEASAPLCYPLLLNKDIDRKKLAEIGVFIPRFWPEILINKRANSQSIANELAGNLLPLPVDQRYRPETLKVMVAKIRDFV